MKENTLDNVSNSFEAGQAIVNDALLSSVASTEENNEGEIESSRVNEFDDGLSTNQMIIDCPGDLSEVQTLNLFNEDILSVDCLKDLTSSAEEDKTSQNSILENVSPVPLLINVNDECFKPVIVNVCNPDIKPETVWGNPRFIRFPESKDDDTRTVDADFMAAAGIEDGVMNGGEFGVQCDGESDSEVEVDSDYDEDRDIDSEMTKIRQERKKVRRINRDQLRRHKT